MPELPEVERARAQLEQGALGQQIVAVDDRDTYVCRPHAPGEIAEALTGATFTAAHRRGKTMWLDTDRGPVLGLHLGMTGAIVFGPPGPTPHWDRFTVELAGGTRMALRDKRRLGRAVLDPDLGRLGPDAAEISRDAFRTRVGTSVVPIKARLLDQGVIAGVGNLLADETLWRARLDPRAPADTLDEAQLDALRRELRAAIREAIALGGVHTGQVMPARSRTGSCPRCGAPMSRAVVGGRTTYWCSKEQG
jgi:formamidopyrimidine-DNA glycosylase